MQHLRLSPHLPVLGAILLLAAGLRLFDLGNVPPGFFTDEASIGYNAYTILTTGRDQHGQLLPLFFRAFGEFKSPVQVYSTVPFITLFSLTEWATRLPAALYGVLAVLVLVLLARRYLPGRWWPLLAGLLLALSPWHVHMSRIAFELAAYVLAFTVAVLLLERARRRPGLLPWFAAACGLGAYTYFAARLTLPFLFGVGLLLLLPRWRSHWRAAGLSAALFAVLLVPLAFHILQGEGQARWTQIGIWAHGQALPLGAMAANYLGHFTPDFLWVRGDGFGRNYIQGFGLMYRVEAPFFVLGILYALWRRLWVVLLWLLIIYPLPGAITADGASNTRDIAGAALFPLLTTLGVYALARISANAFSRVWSAPAFLGRAGIAGVLALFLVALGGSAGLFAREYFGPYRTREYALGFYGWQYGSRQIVEYFLEHQGQYDAFVMEPAFNGPDTLLTFYAPEGCPNCWVARPSADSSYPEARVLFAARVETLRQEGARYTVRDRIEYPNGQLAFLLVEIHGFDSGR